MRRDTWLQKKTGWMGPYRFHENVPTRRVRLRPGTTVAIPTWNGARLLPACLAALREQRRKPVRILIVDNGSSDETEHLVGAVPDVDYLRLSVNEGYSGAAQRAYQSVGTEFLAILNNDARPAPSWLEQLEDVVSSNPGAGCAFPLAVLESGTIDTSGDHLTRAGFVYKGGYQQSPGDLKTSRDSFVLCPGVAPLYRVPALDSIGGWDRGLYSSFEDVDLSIRLWMAGWEIISVREARAVHLQGKTSSRNVALREFLMSRNEAVVLLKTVERGTLIRLIPAHIIYVILSILSHLVRGSLAPYAAGKLAFACSIRDCLSARRSVVSARRIGLVNMERSWLTTWFRLSRLGGRRSPRRG